MKTRKLHNLTVSEVGMGCMVHDIGFVPFSPIASGLLSDRITPQTQFESYDDVRNWLP